MYRSTALSVTTDDGPMSADRWSLCIRDVVADLQPLSIDDLLDFAAVIA